MIQDLSKEAFAKLTEGADILEADRRGAKVYQLPDGRILKVIRDRPRLRRLGRKPRAAIFARNARRLSRRGFATVGVEKVFRLRHARGHALLYHPVPGQTLRSALRNAEDSARRKLLRKTAALLARLHTAGFLFRSVHFANVIVTPAGELGLIDIADIRFRPLGRPLSRRQRIRNFHHLLRYEEDQHQLARVGWDEFLNAYFDPVAPGRAATAFRRRLPALSPRDEREPRCPKTNRIKKSGRRFPPRRSEKAAAGRDPKGSSPFPMESGARSSCRSETV